MNTILVPLLVMTVACFGLLAALKVLEQGHKQKRTAIEEDLKVECASLLTKGKKLDDALVDNLVGEGDLGQVIPKWQLDRGAVLTRIDTRRPWEWDAATLISWAADQKRVRCVNLDAELAKRRATVIAATLVVALIVAVAAYFTTSSSYFTSI